MQKEQMNKQTSNQNHEQIEKWDLWGMCLKSYFVSLVSYVQFFFFFKSLLRCSDGEFFNLFTWLYIIWVLATLNA